MSRPLVVWIVFALCVALGAAALGWTNVIALRSARVESEVREEAAREEKVRLALWRMDSALAPLIAQENARPYFHYGAFYPAERAYTRMFTPIGSGEVLIPSPLLTVDVPHVLLYFQVDPRGWLTSPQAPTGNMRDLAESAYTTKKRIEDARVRLAALSGLAPRATLLARLPGHAPVAPRTVRLAGPTRSAASDPTPTPPPTPSATPSPTVEPPERAAQQQQALNAREFVSRNYSQVMSNEVAIVQQKAVIRKPPSPRREPLPFVSEGPLQPVWHGETLLLARRVWVGPQEYVQGCMLDWPSLRGWLLVSVRDLLPDAALQPVELADASDQGHMLAALPLRLDPGRVPAAGIAPSSSTEVSLGFGWGSALLAVLAGALLLRQALALSERRAAFVSAVTHELRTPLTTFRMYTEMLAQGMVPEEERRRYLLTLQSEAERLDHLVKNVLAYARLESNRVHSRLEVVTVAAIVERSGERLRLRAEQAGLRLTVSVPENVGTATLRTDPVAVEQILFNLVDNACKYAAQGGTVELDVAVETDAVRLRVRDHGPGIAAPVRRQLFRPFTKSASEAARSAPGVGLGLALSRRLARSLGGDLTLDDTVRDGTAFVLRVPLVKR